MRKNIMRFKEFVKNKNINENINEENDNLEKSKDALRKFGMGIDFDVQLYFDSPQSTDKEFSEAEEEFIEFVEDLGMGIKVIEMPEDEKSEYNDQYEGAFRITGDKSEFKKEWDDFKSEQSDKLIYWEYEMDFL